MIAYLDTSAIIPLIIQEPGSRTCRSVWDAADGAACSQLGHVEAVAALARATRLGRISADQERDSLQRLDRLWDEFTVLAVDDPLVRRAGELARGHALRGYDAVHCAAALRIADPELVAVSGDQELLAAWRAEALQVVDTLA